MRYRKKKNTWTSQTTKTSKYKIDNNEYEHKLFWIIKNV